MNKYLSDFRKILSQNEKVSEFEMTSGNYDEGKRIEEKIPTITTEFCEIGIYDDIIYFVFIINSNTYSEKLFNELKNFPNVKFYGFKNFNDTLYPKLDFQYDKFVEKVKQDKYLQVQFDYDVQKISVEIFYQEYVKIKKIFVGNKVGVIDQLKIMKGL